MPMQHDVLVHVRWSEHCCLELQGTVYDSPLGHGLGFLRGWRSWPLSVYSGRPRHRPWTVKRTLYLLSSSFIFDHTHEITQTNWCHSYLLHSGDLPHKYGSQMKSNVLIY